MHNSDEYSENWSTWLNDATKIKEDLKRLLLAGDAVGFCAGGEESLNNSISCLEIAIMLEQDNHDYEWRP